MFINQRRVVVRVCCRINNVMHLRRQKVATLVNSQNIPLTTDKTQQHNCAEPFTSTDQVKKVTWLSGKGSFLIALTVLSYSFSFASCLSLALS